jgi:hypothetical protein
MPEPIRVLLDLRLATVLSTLVASGGTTNWR